MTPYSLNIACIAAVPTSIETTKTGSGISHRPEKPSETAILPLSQRHLATVIL